VDERHRAVRADRADRADRAVARALNAMEARAAAGKEVEELPVARKEAVIPNSMPGPGDRAIKTPDRPMVEPTLSGCG